MKWIRQAGQWIQDTGIVAALCFRLLLSKRWIWVFLGAAGLFYAMLLGGLTEAAEEESRIPLAVVNQEAEGFFEAEGCLAYLKELPVLTLWETSEQEGLRALREGEVAAVLVIEEGYGEWLQTGRYVGGRKPLSLYYQEGQDEQKILAELIAGGVLKQYCFYQSYLLYEEQEGLPSVRVEEYQKTAAQYEKEAEAGAFLEIRYETPAAAIQGGNLLGAPGREAIYLQVVLGMLAGLLLLFALLLYAGGGEPGDPDRSGTGSIGRSAALAGNFLYVLCLEVAAGILFITIFFWKGSRYRAEGGMNVGGALLAFPGYLFLFASMVSLLFLLLREGAGTRERFLPLGMGVFALLAVLGLIRVAASFLPEALEIAVRCSPGGWLVDRLLSLLYG